MSIWGTGDPVVWIDGEQYDLPTPEKRGRNPWQEDIATWPNLKRELRSRFFGFRRVEELTWSGLSTADSEILIALVNVRECFLAPWGVSAPRFKMIVLDHEEYYVEDQVLVDGFWILMQSEQLYPKKIGPQEFYRVASMRGRVIEGTAGWTPPWWWPF